MTDIYSASPVCWQASEPVDRCNLISLRLTNNSCQNVSASCGGDRSWICHADIQVKLYSDMASASNTGLWTLISFYDSSQPLPPPPHCSRFIVRYMADSCDRGNAFYHNMFAICHALSFIARGTFIYRNTCCSATTRLAKQQKNNITSCYVSISHLNLNFQWNLSVEFVAVHLCI